MVEDDLGNEYGSDPVLNPLRVSFALANLELQRPIRFGQFVIRPLGIKGIRRHEEPGRSWELSARGVYVWRDPQPIRALELYSRQRHTVDRLNLLLSFARGGYVPILDTWLESRRGQDPCIKKGVTIRWAVPRGYSTIYDTDEQLETFMEQAMSRFMDDNLAHRQALRGTLSGLVQAFDEVATETQFLHAWLALESIVHHFGSSEYIISPNKFKRGVRRPVKRAIEEAAAADSSIAEHQESMIKKIPELNRAPITDAISRFFEAQGVHVDRAEIEALKRKRDTITHMGYAEKPPPNFTEDWFTDYRLRLAQASWRLINLLRAALLQVLSDDPLRSELRKAFLPGMYAPNEDSSMSPA